MNPWLRKCNLRFFIEQETWLHTKLHNVCHMYNFAGRCESQCLFNDTGGPSEA
jgi:hypothetical protein